MRTPVWWRWMARRVTFSRNLTLSLSRTCRCYCKYCAFATHRAHLHEPEEVERILDGARRHRAKELLVLTGEAPDHHPGVRKRLLELGFEDFTGYAAWACEQALERGLLPHTNLGVLSREDLARLREVTASQGLMLESVNPDLVAHQGSPTKHPEQRLATIRAAGELKIPFTSGILVGIGESEADRMASLEALAGFDHVQEVILQNFVPHRRYYGEEPAEIATEAAEGYWRTGIGDGARARAARVGERGHDRRHEAADRRGAAADARGRHPDPAQPRRLVARAGARGRDRPRRPERQRRPHLARAPVPVARAGAHPARRRGLRALRAPVRLPAVHRRDLAGAARARGHPLPAPLVRAAPPRRRASRPARSSAPATARSSRRRS